MFEPAKPIRIDEEQRKQLLLLAESQTAPRSVVIRARIILLAAEGTPNYSIAKRLGISRPTVLSWRARFVQYGVTGLIHGPKRLGRPSVPAEKVREIVEATIHTTPANAPRWSTRLMAEQFGLSPSTILRIWHEHNLKPHLMNRDPKPAGRPR